jgi:hypothetical protein
MAWSCLYVQLRAYQEMSAPTVPMYLPDDATESELAEMAAEQRRLAVAYARMHAETGIGPAVMAQLLYQGLSREFDDQMIQQLNTWESFQR